MHFLVLQIGAHVLGQHRYRAPGDDGKSGHTQDRLDDDLDMEVSAACPAQLAACCKSSGIAVYALHDGKLAKVPRLQGYRIQACLVELCSENQQAIPGNAAWQDHLRRGS